jgi:glycogen debranching enzyme
MPIIFERDICRSLDETISREWLITNGIGGYAAGTVAGTLTRMQQGLLVASLDEERVPQLLVAKIDEEVFFDQRTYYLGTNEYQDGILNPAGFVHLESFRLEEGFPIFTYRLGGIDGVLLEKRIWMPQDENTTFIQYRVLRTSAPLHSQWSPDSGWRNGERYNTHIRSYSYAEEAPLSLTLTLLPLVAYRPYDKPQYGSNDWQFQVERYPQELERGDEERMLSLPRGVAGCTIRAREKATPYHILAIGHPESQTRFIPTGVWYWRFLRRHNQAADLPPTDDLYLPGVIRTQLWPDKDATLTILLTTEKLVSQPLNQKLLNRSYEQALDHQRNLLEGQRYFGEGGGSIQNLPILPFTDAPDTSIKSDELLQLLYQAGDRLLIQRALPYQERSFFLRPVEHIPTITPGYYQLEDSTREALIALPGLTVTTQRYDEAQRMLRFIGRYFRNGLLPDRLPTIQWPSLEDADYHNVDTALWFFSALDKYLNATRDFELLDELYPRLVDCIRDYTQGTFHGIQVDPADGLLRTAPTGQALTWMNALAFGVSVTPRAGKAVEVNALWYHALCLMHEWSQLLSQRGRVSYTTQQYAEQSEVCRQGFNRRFWNRESNYLYDLVDGPEGHDARLRPNQLLAISLRYAVLDASRQAAVLDVITQQLVTPCGLRTLAPNEPGYQGQLPPNHEELQQALHQGAAWPWLIGSYIDALLRVGDLVPAVHTEGVHRTANLDHYKEHTWSKGLQVLEPLRQHMQQHMLGSISAVYSGDPPYNSGLQLTSAASLGEILRTYGVLAHMGVQHFDQVISA